MKFKKSIALIISAVMVFSSLTSLVSAASVSDISDHWGQPYIQALIDRNVMRGYPDGTFLPDNTITRAEFCTTIVNALINNGNITDYVTTTGTFTDVPADLWSVKYIETAYSNGFVGGKGPGIFDPEAFITRQEMAKIVSLVYCTVHSASFDVLKADADPSGLGLTDLGTADTWATDYINVALKVELMKGDGTTFRPQGLVTRAETATVTFRILGLVIPTATPIVTVEPTATPTISPTDTPTPEPTPVPTLAAIRSHGTKLTIVNSILANFPDFVQPNADSPITLLTDGYANDLHSAFCCDQTEPEFLFDLGSVQDIQSFAISGYSPSAQAVYFRLLISEDKDSWTELGVDVNLKIAQPVIEDKTIYISENFDDLTNTGRLNPAPTKFDTSTTDEVFTIGNYQTRTHNDPGGNEVDTDCFASPMMDLTITSIDWQSYGFVNNNCNYLFHYFMDEVQSARYIKIIGYGNTMKQWYMWSSFTEVQIFGPDTAIAE